MCVCTHPWKNPQRKIQIKPEIFKKEYITQSRGFFPRNVRVVEHQKMADSFNRWRKSMRQISKHRQDKTS